MSAAPVTTPISAATTPSARPVLEHLNSAASATALTSNDVPSVFETLASDELRELVQPAFRYVLAFFAQRYPRYLLRLINRHEEVYAGFLCLVEGYHLQRHNSTFTDNFYGLQFRSISPHLTEKQAAAKLAVPRPGQYQLSTRQKILTLAYIVGIPYLRSKLQDLYERLGGGLDAEIMELQSAADRDDIYRITPRRRLSVMLARTFKQLYPYVNLAYELMTVGYDIAFAFGRTTWWRWWMKLVGIQVVRVGAVDELSGGGVGLEAWLSKFASSSRVLAVLSRMLRPLATISALPMRLFTSINPLATILLALKFLQWWYSPASPRLSAIKGAEERSKVLVKPPRMISPTLKGRSAVNLEREKEQDDDETARTDEHLDDDSDSDEEVSSDSDSSPNGAIQDMTPGTPPSQPLDANLQYRPQVYGSCVICSNEWTNPTITPTGYMGCYLCLYGTVEKHGTCPVTGVPMRVDELRKVLV